jgi:hypothetical protein
LVRWRLFPIVQPSARRSGRDLHLHH